MLPADAKIYCGRDVVEIKDIKDNDQIVASAGWGEVGDANIQSVFTEEAKNINLLQITTSRGAVIRCTPAQLCFGRFNPSVKMYSIYLHERSTLGYRVGITSDIIREAIGMMALNGKSDGKRNITDRIWVIEINPNLTAATFIHKLILAKYGLPDIPFTSKHKDSMLTDEHIRRFFDYIDTPVRAKKLLQDSDMFIEYPHLTLKLSEAENPGSSSVQFVIFGGKEKTPKGNYPHFIQIQGVSDPSSIEQFKVIRKKSSNHGLWYLEVTREDLEEAELFVRTVSNLDDLEVVKKIQLTKKAPYYILPASHLKAGMLVPIMNSRGVIEEDSVLKVEQVEYSGLLYDLQVKSLHNYIVGQWVVMCNSGNIKAKQILL